MNLEASQQWIKAGMRTLHSSANGTMAYGWPDMKSKSLTARHIPGRRHVRTRHGPRGGPGADEEDGTEMVTRWTKERSPG